MSEDKKVIHVDFGQKKVVSEEPDSPKIDDETSEPVSMSGHKKLRFFREAIERGTVMVTLDARRKDVTVPPQFKEYVQLHLNFDYRYGIDDFSFDDNGVRASLSFNGVDCWCDIPWEAIYGIRNQTTSEVKVFPKSVPPEML